MLPRTLLATTGLAVAAALSLPAIPSLAATAVPDGDDLARIRAATAAFHRVEAAEAAGYVTTVHCESGPEGAMGIHYIQPELAADPALDPDRPEILLYEPDERGRLRLVGVEWWTPDLGQERPEVWGVPLDGPMAGHNPDMPVHYDLHVWVWKHNPSGVTASWNPAVDCPQEHDR